MKQKRFDPSDDGLSCCERRALLRGLGATGLLMFGGCTTSGGQRPDRGLPAVDEGVVAADKGAPSEDTSFTGVDGGLPPIDLAMPQVTQTATFALG